MDKKHFSVISVLVCAMAAILVTAALYTGWMNLPEHYVNRISHLAESGKMEEANRKYEEMRRVLAERLDREVRTKCEYALACGMFAEGRYKDAQLLFGGLEGYADSQEMIKACYYELACIDLENGKFHEAAETFRSLGVFGESQTKLKDCRVLMAEELYAAGKLSEAFSALVELGDHPGAKERAYEIACVITGDEQRAQSMLSGDVSPEEQERRMALEFARKELPIGKIAAGRYHSVALQSDGSVVAVGSNEFGQCDVSTWKDVIYVCAGAEFTLGLKADGTVLATGNNDHGQLNAATWTDVVAIAANDYNALGVTADGELLFCGFNNYSNSLGGYIVTDVYAGTYQVACRLEDGTIVSSHPSAVVNGKPVSVALSTAIAVSLDWDGSLVSSFERTPDWNNIVALAMNGRAIIGVNADGSVETFTFRETDALSVPADAENIVAVSAGGGHYLLLDKEGNVHAFGDNDFGQCDTAGWNLN